MPLKTRLIVGFIALPLAVFVALSVTLFQKTVVAEKSSAPAVATTVAPVQKIKTLPAKVVAVSPQDGAKDVVLDIEDPIVVRFDTSVKDVFVDFRLDPPIAVTYENNPDKTEFKILPKEPLQLGTSYTLSIFTKQRDMDDASYKPLASSQFTTVQADLTPAQRTVAMKISEAKQTTVAQITEGRYIDITLATQTMVLFEDGKPVDAYIISSGKRGLETPKGSFTIHNKAKRAWSKAYGLWMPYWMAILPSGKVGIHELPEWPNGYKEGAAHLGIPVSHGCVRLGVGPEERVFNFADIGTPVVVH
jgi:lipoprotein-anchoring transpeptidase ErfK/SrfK